jgi:hypothetical protein
MGHTTYALRDDSPASPRGPGAAKIVGAFPGLEIGGYPFITASMGT